MLDSAQTDHRQRQGDVRDSFAALGRRDHLEGQCNVVGLKRLGRRRAVTLIPHGEQQPVPVGVGFHEADTNRSMIGEAPVPNPHRMTQPAGGGTYTSVAPARSPTGASSGRSGSLYFCSVRQARCTELLPK